MLYLKIPLKKMFSKKRIVLIFFISLGCLCLIYWSLFLNKSKFIHSRYNNIALVLKQQQQQQQQQYKNISTTSTELFNQNLNQQHNNNGIADFNENLIIIYNRVPKTGSTSFVNIAYDLCKKNKFHVIHINVTANMHVLSLPNQIEFVRNVTNWHEMKPALYHGHMAFLDFSKYGMPFKPIYINLIRKPLDRFVSYYYFLRYGDNYRPNLIRKKAGDKMTFDDCVEKKQPDCDAKNMWIQIPFFCGHAAECWNPGSQWALEQAKQNLINQYFLVGVTEDMENFINLLELSLPRIFTGSLEYFLQSSKSHLRQTKSKIEPNENTINEIKKTSIWKMENELYEFALEQFNYLLKYQNVIKIQGKNVTQKFFFEKIRPK